MTCRFRSERRNAGKAYSLSIFDGLTYKSTLHPWSRKYFVVEITGVDTLTHGKRATRETFISFPVFINCAI
jgi:hypothetical protein